MYFRVSSIFQMKNVLQSPSISLGNYPRPFSGDVPQRDYEDVG